MAATNLQVAQTGSAIAVAAKGTFARWILFVNNAAAAMAIGGALGSTLTLTNGVPLGPGGGTYFLPPMPEGGSQHYDLGQFVAIGTSAQNLTVIYDAMN
jgi:hypothetical protein